MKLIIGLDVPTLEVATPILRKIKDAFSHVKIGHVLLSHTATDTVLKILSHCALFLDLKFFDIPNTVVMAVAGYQKIFPNMDYFTFHGVAGDEMISAVQEVPNLKALPLAVLSLSSEVVSNSEFLRRAQRNWDLGIRGFICPGTFLQVMRTTFGDEITLITPGVREPSVDAVNDHQLAISPHEARQYGADFIVVGRPILHSQNPLMTAKQYLT